MKRSIVYFSRCCSSPLGRYDLQLRICFNCYKPIKTVLTSEGKILSVEIVYDSVKDKPYF
jgi:hypothetical protein